MLSLEKPFREKLMKIYQEAPLDAASFHRNYKACSDCGATCCSGGSAFYMKEEADTVRALVKEHREFFLKNDIPVDGPCLDEETNPETGVVEISTNVRPMDYAPGKLPEHFDETACVFRRRSDGFCTLQVLSIEQGKPSWWFKPLACWLFPLEIEQNGKPHIHVAHASTDEYVDEEYPGFVAFTSCGAECKDGKPAYQVLQHEIAALAKMLDRDLMGEIMAYKKSVA